METTNPTNTTTDNCQGMVAGVTDHPSVPTDSWTGRYCNVTITRCTACAGSAHVQDDEGRRWVIAIPNDYARDNDMAAYWATEVSQFRTPTYTPDVDDVPEFTDEEWDAMGVDDWVEDEDGSQAFARSLERKAEAGTWFGADPF